MHEIHSTALRVCFDAYRENESDKSKSVELKMMGCPHDFRRLGTAHLYLAVVLAAGLMMGEPAWTQQTSADAGSGFVNTLTPLPATVVGKAGALKIDSTFSYAVKGNAGARVELGEIRLMRRLAMRTGVPFATDTAVAEKQAHLQRDDGNATLTVDVATASSGPPVLGEDESYTLDVDQHHIILRAQTDDGALRGMETLLQLTQPVGSGFAFPAVHIEDAPRFPWRGLMLDAGRHFLPVEVIYRTLDGMAAVKLNVLHWHLSEDQGFRIESKVFPKLQELGSERQYYTQQQVREVVAYAAARGIRVVPEFDIPGHSTSWMVGYPELGSAPGPYSVSHEFGIRDAALNPVSGRTYRFLDAFFGEMSQLFPDAYIHIGGDESNGKQWLANPQIKAFMDAHGMKSTQELQAYFNTRVQKILAKHHKRMAGWDEILNPALPSDIAIQVWHGNEFLVNAAKQGHSGIYSQQYYLDHMRSAAEVFLADPVPAGADLTPQQLKLILGGEACMWGEHLVPQTIDSRIWPRAAAVAERFWSPAADRDANDMYRRLAVESLRLEEEGLTHISGPEKGLRQLAGTTQIQPLEVFAGTLQPVDFHVRSSQQHPSTLTVFDHLVDAVRPDPPLRHQFEMLVDSAVHGDRGDIEKLDSIFHSWVDNAPALDRLAAGSPLLQEASQHIAVWPKLGSMGLDALSYIRSGKAPPAGWQAARMALLGEANKPQELVDFVVLGPLDRLVAAANATNTQSVAPVH